MAVEVSLARASVRVSGAEVPLPGRVLELALYLAAQAGPVSALRLRCALLGRDVPAHENAIKVYVHRLRSVIGRDAVVCTRGTYGFDGSVRIDLPEIEAFVARAERGALLRPAMRIRAERILTELSMDRTDLVDGWEWFSAVERRLRSLQRRLNRTRRP